MTTKTLEIQDNKENTVRLYQKKQVGFFKHVIIHKWLYIMLIPGILYFATFRYAPMGGIVIAFQNFVPHLGVGGSEWVGLMWFREFFGSPDFIRLLTNTMALGLLSITIGFLAPIILALLLNELKGAIYKRCIQTAIYVPHFISWTIVTALTMMLFNSNGGIVFDMITNLLGREVHVLTDPNLFRGMILVQGIWKSSGFGTIIYLAALSSVDPELYEAAVVDGAGRWRRLWHITLPAIRPTIVIMLILACGGFLSTGFEQIYLMTNAMNRSVADVFDVFVFQIGLRQGMFSYATAVGLFNSLVGIVLIIIANLIAKKVDPEAGIF
jgi:putative aldouronate transport system permease protein